MHTLKHGKTSVKFQNNRNKTVGGYAQKVHTCTTERRRAENYVPPLFFEKLGDNKIFYEIGMETCRSK